MYDVIEAMKLDNLSILKHIPDFYVSFIFRYIIQIARAFARCHKNNLVHGNFDFSKVLAQKPPTIQN